MRGLGEIFDGAVKDVLTFLRWANVDVFDGVNALAARTDWLHPVMVGYASFGVVGFAALLLAGWWLARRATSTPSWSRSAPVSASAAPPGAGSPDAGSRGAGSPDAGSARRMAAALWAPAGMMIALGLNQIVVAFVHEARPYTVLPDALVLVARTADYAFPSDHAVMAGAVAAPVWLVSRRLGCLAAAAALLMAFARVYVGAHWPGDVLAGLVFGATVTMLGYLLARTPLTLAVTALTRTGLRPLLTAHYAPASSLPGNLALDNPRTEPAKFQAVDSVAPACVTDVRDTPR